MLTLKGRKTAVLYKEGLRHIKTNKPENKNTTLHTIFQSFGSERIVLEDDFVFLLRVCDRSILSEKMNFAYL